MPLANLLYFFSLEAIQGTPLFLNILKLDSFLVCLVNTIIGLTQFSFFFSVESTVKPSNNVLKIFSFIPLVKRLPIESSCTL